MDQNNSPVTDKSIKKFRNSLVVSFLLLFVMFGVFAAQTYAYFWDKTTVTNKIQSGNLDVELLELTSTGEELLMDLAPVRFIPGAVISKTFKISNKGDVPVYVRVKIEKKIINNEKNLPDGWEDLISCEFNLDDESTPNVTERLWTYRDGYYYYYGRIEPNMMTPSLFDEITFSKEMGNEFANTKLEFKVICQSVQANGNSASPLTAWGWPTEN